MADYYSILNKTIAGLSDNTADMRKLVYEKARGAIEKQLRSMDPPPGEEQIAGQMKQLDEAIAKVEADHLQSEPQAVDADPVSEPASEETPTEPETVKTIPEEPEKMAGATAEDSGTGPVAEPVPASSDTVSVADPATGQIAPSPGSTPVTENLQDASPPAGTPSADAGIAQPATPAPPPDTAVTEPPRPVSTGMDRPLPGDIGVPAGPRKRIVPYLLAYLLLAAMLVAGGYALWTNKDALMQGFANLTGGTEQASEPEPVEEATDSEPDSTTEPSEENVVEEAQTDTSGESGTSDTVKEPVRLGEDGEDVVAEPVEPEVSQGETEVPLVLEQPEENAGPEAEVQPVDEVGENSEPVESGEAVVQPIVGNSAFLYEEGGSGEGASRSNGSIVWSVEQESPETGLQKEPVIVGRMDIPDKGLTLDLKIKRNTDPALSASHIIELLFSSPDGNPGDAIDNVARFVMKATEAARGDQLVAVPVRIDSGFFLIALNNLEQAIKTNTRMMEESEWIDIPVGYASGRRALVTLEKGDAGKSAFQEAFADWKNR